MVTVLGIARKFQQETPFWKCFVFIRVCLFPSKGARQNGTEPGACSCYLLQEGTSATSWTGFREPPGFKLISVLWPQPSRSGASDVSYNTQLLESISISEGWLTLGWGRLAAPQIQQGMTGCPSCQMGLHGSRNQTGLSTAIGTDFSYSWFSRVWRWFGAVGKEWSYPHYGRLKYSGKSDLRASAVLDFHEVGNVYGVPHSGISYLYRNWEIRAIQKREYKLVIEIVFWKMS